MGVSVVIKRKRRVVGSQKKVVAEVTFDNSYAENGEPLTAAQLGLKKVNESTSELVHGSEAEGIGSAAHYEAAAGKIHLFNSKTGKEVVGAADCSHVVVQVTAYGH